VIIFAPGEINRSSKPRSSVSARTVFFETPARPSDCLDDVSLFPATGPWNKMSPGKNREILDRLPPGRFRSSRAKRVLIVDDDIRNIFAMTSILEPHQMQITSAEKRPKMPSRSFKKTPEIDIVLDGQS